MKIVKTIKPATPWNVSLTKLTNLENSITASEGAALKARWLFGRELVNRRIDYKGRLVIPRDLMALTTQKCEVGRHEIIRRIRFAERYPTKDLMFDAIKHYPSWYRMTHEGLVEKKRNAPKKETTPVGRWFIPRLNKEVEKAFSHHVALTRAQVKDLEHLYETIKKVLDQIDVNDKERAS